jgi:hypothetical protein
MSDERRFGWLGATALFLAGCVVAFLVLRYWQGVGTSVAPVAQQTSKSRWRIQADFKLPRSVIVNSPDKLEILLFEVGRPKIEGLIEYYPVSIKNLSDHIYPVAYEIFAYDAQNRRVDETSDSVTIGAKETVLRQLDFDHPLSVDARKFASFRLIADIEH